jgi:ABC-type branched-subunit amino acid transport system substrate-binding protein
MLVGQQGLLAQSGSYKDRYEAGLYLIQAENWNEAQQVFKELSLVPEDDKLKPAIQYFLAYAYFKQGDLLRAQVAINRLTEDVPEWEFEDDALFLKGEIAYARGKYTAAWNALKKVNHNAEFKKAVEALHHKYLVKAPQDTLNYLKQLYPESSTLAEIIAQRKGGVIVGAGKLSSSPQRPMALQKQDTLYVALLLPLNLQNADVQKSASYNTSVLDFYKGAHLAIQDLLANSVPVRCFVYDNKKQKNELKRLLELKELRSMDLLIGPGFADGIEAMRLFSAKHHIPVINALNTPVRSGEAQDALFSLIPTPESVAQAVFKTIQSYSSGKKCAIIYGVQRRDSLFAFAYKKRAEQAGFQVPVFKNVGKNSAANLTKFLLPMMDDTLGHILLPNDVDLVRTQTLASIDYLKLRQPAFVFSDWLDQPNADFEAFNNRRLYFIDQDFHDKYTDSARLFARQYTTQFGLAPSFFAWRGYEVMRVFVALMAEKGADFTSYLKTAAKINGHFSPGFQFNHLGENIYCPVLQLKNLQITDQNQTPTSE